MPARLIHAVTIMTSGLRSKRNGSAEADAVAAEGPYAPSRPWAAWRSQVTAWGPPPHVPSEEPGGPLRSRRAPRPQRDGGLEAIEEDAGASRATLQADAEGRCHPDGVARARDLAAMERDEGGSGLPAAGRAPGAGWRARERVAAIRLYPSRVAEASKEGTNPKFCRRSLDAARSLALGHEPYPRAPAWPWAARQPARSLGPRATTTKLETLFQSL